MQMKQLSTGQDNVSEEIPEDNAVDEGLQQI